MTLSKAEKAARAERRAEREAKRLDPERVNRHNAGREVAEQGGRRGPGRPGSKADKPAANVEEAKRRVEADRVAATKPAPAHEAEQEFRDPTKFEINSVRFAMKMGNKPLVQLERDLEQFGVVSETGAPPALVKKGEIPASDEELDMGAEATAATLVNFAPSSFVRYLAPITLAMFTIGFVGSRLVIFLRIKRAMDEAAKAEREAEQRRAEAARSKLNPTAAPGNGFTVHEGGS